MLFVGTSPFRRIALRVAMETMQLNIARITYFLGVIFGGMPGVQMNKLTPIKLVLGYQGRSN